MINFIKVLDEEQISKCLNSVDELKKYYEPLPEGYFFETLGAASYIHCNQEYKSEKQISTRYDKIKDKINPVLFENFEWLYDILIETLSKELNSKCLISPKADLAYPGFHIFYPHEQCEKVWHFAHFDSSWMFHLDKLKNIYTYVDDTEYLTFTLSIKLPHNGAGLYYWDLPDNGRKYSFSEGAHAMKDILNTAHSFFVGPNECVDRETYEQKTQPSILEYKEGWMTFFTQPILHQIMPFNINWKQEDRRITLQGHGIKCENNWILYF